MNIDRNDLAPRMRAVLLQRAAAIGSSLEHEVAALHDLAGRDVGDFKDVATEMAATTVDEGKARHAAAELEQISAALRRMRDGTYGYCLDCDQPIDPRRLAAVPVAAYCASCQAMYEQHRM